MVGFILLTPTLSSRRGSPLTMQPVVFKLLKKCVNTYTQRERGFFRGSLYLSTFQTQLAARVH
jgi:hypothetical protein